MKRMAVSAAACALSLAIVGVHAASAGDGGQIQGKVRDFLKRADQVRDQLQINDQQEQEIGAAVSERIRQRYGVVQDAAVHKYVSLVGALLVQASSRPGLAWKFIVLDTDGVNAFAAPGGYIHVTRGALAMLKNEAELAGVLGHEMTHVTEKHTIRAIQKGKLVQMGADRANITKNSEIFRQLVDRSTEIVMAGFGRADELEADQKGIRLAGQVGYAATPFADFLGRLAERNQESSGKQGLFASHPEVQERISALRRQIAGERFASTVTLADRYHRNISYKPGEQADIAAVEEGAAGLTGSKAQPKTTTPKKKAFGLAGLLKPGTSEKKSAEVTGSAAARGVDKELGAPGGPVKTMINVTVTPGEVAAFRKDGNLK